MGLLSFCVPSVGSGRAAAPPPLSNRLRSENPAGIGTHRSCNRNDTLDKTIISGGVLPCKIVDNPLLRSVPNARAVPSDGERGGYAGMAWHGAGMKPPGGSASTVAGQCAR